MGKTKKNLSLLLVVVFIFSFNAGVAVHMDDDGDMTGCPFMGMDAICQMGLFEHIRIFQGMFVGIPAKSISFATALFLAIVSLAITFRINAPPSRIRFLVKENLRLLNFNRILLALSDGIVQPKLYA